MISKNADRPYAKLSNFRIRPVTEADLEGIYQLALEAKAGLTSLPKDHDLLRKRIALAQTSFAKGKLKQGCLFLFVLEDIETGAIAGTCALQTRKGDRIPDDVFCYGEKTMYSKSLDLTRKAPFLKRQVSRSRPTEMMTLYLSNTYRHKGLGRFLSFSRFLFMAVHKTLIGHRVIADFRGYSQADGYCPFWQHLGFPFVGLDFSHAELLASVDHSFMRELLPVKRVYLDLAHEDVRRYLGQLHPNTVPAYQLLLRQGFQPCQTYDLFDGGPRVSAKRWQIRSIRETKQYPADTMGAGKRPVAVMMVSNTKRSEFRATVAPVRIQKGRVLIGAEALAALGIAPGEEVAVCPL